MACFPARSCFSNACPVRDSNSMTTLNFVNKTLQPTDQMLPSTHSKSIDEEVIGNHSMPSMLSALDPSIPSMPSTSDHLMQMSSKESNQEKFYFCKLCNDTNELSDYWLFRLHIDSVHLRTGPPFTCKVCHKEFKFRSTCRNHIMAHMLFRDNGCRQSIAIRRFSNRSSISEFIRI